MVGTSRSLKTLLFFAVLFAFFSIGIHNAKANNCASTGAGGNYNVAANWTSCGGVAPQNTDTITIDSGSPIAMTQATTTAGVTINSGATLSSAGFLLTDTGNYINNGTDSGTGNIAINGASAVIGGTGATTDTGTFTISGATAPTFSSTSTLTISGPLTMSGPVTISSGSIITELNTTAISGAVTITNNGTFNASSTNGITGTVTGSTWTQGPNSTLNFGGNTTTFLSTGTLNATNTDNTVNYDEGAGETCKVTQYYNLTISGAGTKTCTPTSPILGNLVYGPSNGTLAWTMTTAITVNGNLTVSAAAGTITTGGAAFTVSGTTSISAGTLSLTNSAGAKTLTGMVTLNGGTLSGAATSTVFGAGITDNSGTVLLTGSSTFSTAGATLSGVAISAIGLASVIVTSPGTVTNNGSVLISNTLSGTGSWTQGSNSTLNLSFAGTPISVTGFDAATNVNTVNYNGAAQTCLATQYNNLTLSGSGTKTCTPTSPILGNLIYSGTGAWTITNSITVNANLTVSAGTVTLGLITGPSNFTVSGTTTISAGTLSLTNFSTPTLTGMVTLNGGTLSGAATSTIFGAGITNTAGTISLTGSSTFATAGATLSGANSIAIAAIIVTSPGTVTNNGTTTLSNTLTGNGSWTQGSGSLLTVSFAGTPISITSFNASSNVNTVSYIAAGTQTCLITQYYNLTLGGTSAKTCAPTSPILGNFVMTGTASWTQTTAETVNGNLSFIGTGATLTTGGVAFTVSGTTSMSSGVFSLTNSAGAKTLTGMVTLTGGTLSGAATSTVFGAGITNTAGTVSIAGSSTFSTAGATLSGANLISIAAVTVTSPGTVTNNGTTTIFTTLSGTGSWTQGSSSTLNLPGTGSPISVSSFTATNTGNLVNYNFQGAQTCNATQYFNLTLSGTSAAGGGNKTCAPTSPILGNLAYIPGSSNIPWTLTTALTVNGNLTVATGTMTLGGAFAVDGNVTITSGILDDAAGGNYPLTIDGNYSNSGTFQARAGSVTLAGSTEQQLSGSMTGSSAFYNLTITNNSGAAPSDCEITGFTPSVAFLAGASSTNNYTITTGGGRWRAI